MPVPPNSSINLAPSLKFTVTSISLGPTKVPIVSGIPPPAKASSPEFINLPKPCFLNTNS